MPSSDGVSPQLRSNKAQTCHHRHELQHGGKAIICLPVGTRICIYKCHYLTLLILAVICMKWDGGLVNARHGSYPSCNVQHIEKLHQMDFKRTGSEDRLPGFNYWVSHLATVSSNKVLKAVWASVSLFIKLADYQHLPQRAVGRVQRTVSDIECICNKC